MQHQKSCCVCLESCGSAVDGLSCSGQHFICAPDLPKYLKENVFPHIAKLRDSRCSVKCPAPSCTHRYDTMELFGLMSTMDRSRYISIIRDVVIPEVPMIKKLHQFILDLMTLKCPTCSNPVDPFPDACSAIMCLFCGKHYCNYCFKGFASSKPEDDRAAAHEHAAQHNVDMSPETRDAFLTRAEIVVGQRAHLTSLLVKCVRLALASTSTELGSQDGHLVALAVVLAERELTDLGIQARDIWEGAHAKSGSSGGGKGAGGGAAMCLSEDDDDEGVTSGKSSSSESPNTAGGKSKAGGRAQNKKFRGESTGHDASDPLSAGAASSSLPAPAVVKQGGLQIANAILTDNAYAVTQVMQTFRGPMLDVNYIEQTHGHPIATLAVLAGQPRVAVELIRAGADPLLYNSDGRSVLYIAAESGSYDVITTIWEMHKDINLNAPCTREMQRYFPMHVAARYNHRSIVRYLAEHGAQLDPEEGEHGYTPLTLALVLGHQLVAAELIRLGCGLRKYSLNGRTPMFVAAEKGLTEIIHLVIHHRKFDINESVVNPSGLRLLHVAAFHHKTQVVCQLIELGADVDQRDEDGGYCPLAMAIIGDSTMSAIELIDAGANVRTVSKAGSRTPLYFAIEKGMAEVVSKIVLEHGVSVNEPAANETNSSLPLHLALLHSQSHLVPLLLRLGADVSLKDSEKNCTALLTAVILEDEWSARKIMACGADPLERTSEGRSSLYIASEKGSVSMIRLLLERGGVCVNDACTTEAHRGTPLHIAAMFNNAHAVIELLEHGADAAALDGLGRRALDVAAEMDSEAATECLLEWDRRPRGPGGESLSRGWGGRFKFEPPQEGEGGAGDMTVEGGTAP